MFTTHYPYIVIQPRHEVPSYVGVQLCVQGCSIPKPRSYTYIRKTTSNTSDSSNVAEVSSPSKQVDCNNFSNKVIVSEQSSGPGPREESSANCDRQTIGVGESSVAPNLRPTSSRNSTAASTPASSVKTGQTGLLTSNSKSHPTSLNVVEINCKLPNTNLRVS